MDVRPCHLTRRICRIPFPDPLDQLCWHIWPHPRCWNCWKCVPVLSLWEWISLSQRWQIHRGERSWDCRKQGLQDLLAGQGNSSPLYLSPGFSWGRGQLFNWIGFTVLSHQLMFAVCSAAIFLAEPTRKSFKRLLLPFKVLPDSRLLWCLPNHTGAAGAGGG